MSTIRIGIVGLGANTRLRHIPGLLACDDVELYGVCNRSTKTTRRAAVEYGIPKDYDRWEDLVADPDLDAVVIGTWALFALSDNAGCPASGKTRADGSSHGDECCRSSSDVCSQPGLS